MHYIGQSIEHERRPMKMQWSFIIKNWNSFSALNRKQQRRYTTTRTRVKWTNIPNILPFNFVLGITIENELPTHPVDGAAMNVWRCGRRNNRSVIRITARARPYPTQSNGECKYFNGICSRAAFTTKAIASFLWTSRVGGGAIVKEPSPILPTCP